MTEIHPKARYPRDAASLILVRQSNGSPEILMGRRPRRQAFMPDVYVFPGGAVDPRDGYAEIAKDYHPAVRQALTRQCTVHRARALGLAAIRETYEETGLFFGVADQAFSGKAATGWEAFAEAQIKPDLGALGFIARAITPKGPPRRFHARFFVADARHAHGSLTQNEELLDLSWIPIDEIDRLPTANVTELVVREVATALSLQPEEDAARGIPFITRRMGKRVIRYEMGDGRIVRGLFESAVDGVK
jgi:8-oxo-dGTP pyrophosphatase MutT (NUDIX family)